MKLTESYLRQFIKQTINEMAERPPMTVERAIRTIEVVEQGYKLDTESANEIISLLKELQSLRSQKNP